MRGDAAMTASAPAPSALRITAPTLPGFSTASITTTSGSGGSWRPARSVDGIRTTATTPSDRSPNAGPRAPLVDANERDPRLAMPSRTARASGPASRPSQTIRLFDRCPCSHGAAKLADAVDERADLFDRARVDLGALERAFTRGLAALVSSAAAGNDIAVMMARPQIERRPQARGAGRRGRRARGHRFRRGRAGAAAQTPEDCRADTGRAPVCGRSRERSHRARGSSGIHRGGPPGRPRGARRGRRSRGRTWAGRGSRRRSGDRVELRARRRRERHRRSSGPVDPPRPDSSALRRAQATAGRAASTWVTAVPDGGEAEREQARVGEEVEDGTGALVEQPGRASRRAPERHRPGRRPWSEARGSPRRDGSSTARQRRRGPTSHDLARSGGPRPATLRLAARAERTRVRSIDDTWAESLEPRAAAGVDPARSRTPRSRRPRCGA